jgi:predicted Rossmann-fold nucleotide-binding protein
LRIHAKPIVLVDADGFYGGLVDWLDGLTRQNFTYEGAMQRLHVVPTVDAALDLIEGTLP